MAQPRVLVLEDDLNMLESLCGVLRFNDYDVRAADNPQTALELIKILPFQLVVSDIRLAGPMNGLEAVRQIKRFRPKLKVVMITGYADDQAGREAMELLVDDYVHKPVKLAVLMEVVERVLQPPPSHFSPLVGLRALLEVPMKLMNQAKAARVQRLLGLLEIEKEKVLQAFFVGLRSRSLSKSAALELWDQLEKLEAQWLQLTSHPAEESLQQVGIEYRKVFEKMSRYQQSGQVVSSPPRPEGSVTRAGFSGLVDQVQAGKVDPQSLLLLLEARLQPAKSEELNPYLLRLLTHLSST